MQIVITRSTDKLPSIVDGPTMTLVNRDIHQEEHEMEDGTKVTEWVATQYRFEAGEYALVRAGILPDGAEWDAELRRIERSAIYDEADVSIAKAQDYIASGATGWQDYIDAMRAYKMEVRESVEQPGFPSSVTYPDAPVMPE